MTMQIDTPNTINTGMKVTSNLNAALEAQKQLAKAKADDAKKAKAQAKELAKELANVARKAKAKAKAREKALKEAKASGLNCALRQQDIITDAIILELARQKLESIEYDKEGNVIVHVDLTEKQADMLNLIFDELDGSIDNAGNFFFIPVSKKFTSSQSGILGHLRKEGFLNKVTDGWVPTTLALNMLGVSMDDIKENYFDALNNL